MRYTPSQFLISYTIFPLFLVGVLFYFSYHAINGERGLLSRERLLLELDHLKHEQKEVLARRSVIQARIRDLGAGVGVVDRDLLSEQVRKLGMIQNNEIELKETFVPPSTVVSRMALPF